MENKSIIDQNQVRHYIVFALAEKQFALPLEWVERVVHAVGITELPKAPKIVRGLINYKGRIMPVINISERFHLPESEIQPNQHFILVQIPTREFCLVSDDVMGVIQYSKEDIVEPDEVILGVEFLLGILRTKTGMILIPNLEKLLTHDEETALNSALSPTDDQNENV